MKSERAPGGRARARHVSWNGHRSATQGHVVDSPQPHSLTKYAGPQDRRHPPVAVVGMSAWTGTAAVVAAAGVTTATATTAKWRKESQVRHDGCE